MRESLRARLARFTVKSCLRPALQPTFPVSVQRQWANIATRTLSVPFGVRFSQSTLGGVPTEIVRSKSNARSAGAILFLHGGAFMIGYAARRDRAATTSQKPLGVGAGSAGAALG